MAGGQAKLDQALDADEKAIAEAERVAAEKRKAAAQSARDLAVLARGTDVVKAVAYYQRATRLDPSDPETWHDYARAALDAGRTAEAKTAFEQAAAEGRREQQATLALLGDAGIGRRGGGARQSAQRSSALRGGCSYRRSDRQGRPGQLRAGSAICRCPTTGSATFWWRRAICPRR